MKMIYLGWSWGYPIGKWRFEVVISTSQFWCGLGITYWFAPAFDLSLGFIRLSVWKQQPDRIDGTYSE